jgi:hypothetical protein
MARFGIAIYAGGRDAFYVEADNEEQAEEIAAERLDAGDWESDGSDGVFYAIDQHRDR